ncbi:MAG: YlxR family protein, partial [Clostridia bacterium]|nr:YlxR family protein [Clostridia bacterium]
MRMCIACHEMKAKKELIRVVKSPEGEINIDLKGKVPGRGAYLCKNQICMDMAAKRRQLEKAFSIKIEQEVYEKLKAQLNEGEVD